MRKKTIAIMVIFAGIATSMPAHAEMPPPHPGQSVINFLKSMFSFLDVSDSDNWPVLAAFATLIHYTWIYRYAMATARENRKALVKRLDELQMSKEAKDKLLKEIDEKIAELEKRIAEAEKAGKELDAHIRTIKQRGKSRAREISIDFHGIEDVAKLEKWMAGVEGQRFLNTERGQRWLLIYNGLKARMTDDVTAPLHAIITNGNRFFPNEPFHFIESVPHAPGTFSSRNDFDHTNSAPYGMAGLPGRMRNVEARCKLVNALVADEMGTVGKDAQWFRFWTRWKNIRSPLTHAAFSASMLGGTFWLTRVYDFDSRQARRNLENKGKTDAATDLAGTLTSPDGREAMAPYYNIVRQVLKEHRADIIAMLERNLTADEKAKLNIPEIVDKSFDSVTLAVALEQATIAAAKQKQGDRVSDKALFEMLAKAKTDKAVREGLYRAFSKEVYKGLANNLWADLTVGNPSDSFDIAVMRSILKRTEELLNSDVKIQPPPPDKVPPAPGTMPPTKPLNEPPPGGKPVDNTGMKPKEKNETMVTALPSPMPAMPVMPVMPMSVPGASR